MTKETGMTILINETIKQRTRETTLLTPGEREIYESALKALIYEHVPIERLGAIEMILRFYHPLQEAELPYWNEKEKRDELLGNSS